MVHVVNKWDFSTTLSVSVFQNYLLERHQSLLSLEAGGGGMWVFWGDHMVSGKTEGESFVANRVWDCKKLTTNERWGGGGCHKIITEP